jgi:hypothetical protein
MGHGLELASSMTKSQALFTNRSMHCADPGDLD